MYGGHIATAFCRAPRASLRRPRLPAALALARSHDLNPLWITCNPDNIASRRTCELAGATLVEIVDLPENTDMYLAESAKSVAIELIYKVESFKRAY